MTEPSGFDLLELATPFALNAVSDDERAAIESRLAAAPTAVSNAFFDEVRAIGETMAILSAVTATEPPERLRAAVLSGAQPARQERSRWRTALLAAAAAIVVALAAFGAGLALRPSVSPTMADQIIAASDVHTSSAQLSGGTATVLVSHHLNAALLVMNDVPPPAQGTVYQMWLVGDNGPQSAGTMNAAAVTPSVTHTVTDLGQSQVLAFTIEPGDGSPQPTGTILTKLPLS